MNDLTPLQHMTRAENIYSRFGATNPILPGEHSAFLMHVCGALKGKLDKETRADALAMLQTITHYMGIPGAMHGIHPLFNGSGSRTFGRARHPTRDADGRWNMHPDMIEGDRDTPVVINWAMQEDYEWLLSQEYADAYKETIAQV